MWKTFSRQTNCNMMEEALMNHVKFSFLSPLTFKTESEETLHMYASQSGEKKKGCLPH